jgi:hypothetical protein
MCAVLGDAGVEVWIGDEHNGHGADAGWLDREGGAGLYPGSQYAADWAGA